MPGVPGGAVPPLQPRPPAQPASEGKVMTEDRPDSLKKTALSVLASGAPLTLEAWAVACWDADKAFGLKGFAGHFPDPQRLRNVVYGPRGLRRRGLVEQDGDRWSVSEDGLCWLAGKPTPPPVRAELKRAMKTAAYSLFCEGRKLEISLNDLAAFYGNGMGAAVFDKLLAGDEDPRVRVLAHCHNWLKGAFARQLAAAS
jgi:hypothetical protein